MKLIVHYLLYSALCVVLLPAASTAKASISARAQSTLAQAEPTDHLVLWVHFKDKGQLESMRSSVPKTVVSERSLKRRRNVFPADRLVDYTDLPVEEAYVRDLSAKVLRIRQRSKWFNAVSVVATPDQLEHGPFGANPLLRSIEREGIAI